MGKEPRMDIRTTARVPDPAPPVAAYLADCSPAVREGLLGLRTLVYQVAAEDQRIGPLQETLKWGEPSYLTEVTRSGTTLRLAVKKSIPATYGLFFNCRTRLAERITDLYPDTVHARRHARPSVFRRPEYPGRRREGLHFAGPDLSARWLVLKRVTAR
jgi:hypothetical protein